jgi:hypothetical protein
MVQAIIFWKIDQHFLMEVDVSPTQTLVSSIAYWQHLNIT